MGASPPTASGGCLCGAVRFTVANPPAQVGACHCEMCRRWASGPMIAIHPETPLTIDRDESLTWYRSSEWAERGFCGTCGTSLFYRLVDQPDEVIPSVGAFDDQGIFDGMAQEIFIDEKPVYYDFAGERPRITGADLIAQFTGGTPTGAKD